MTKKCSASHCITASSRSGKISCAKCRRSFHLKCVGLSASQHKALRDFPGAEWFCPACRNSPFDLEQSSINPALNLILTRLSSILRLVGGQIDVTRTLCRALNDSNRRSSSCIPDRPSIPVPVSEGRNFEDALNNIQFEFSNVFGSFIADAANISDTKRDRSSSLSSSNLTSSRTGKKMRVDVSVDTSDIPNVTVSSISGDASASIPVNNGSILIAAANATPTLVVSTGTSVLGHTSNHSVTTANTATSTTTAASNAPTNSSITASTSTANTACTIPNAATTTSSHSTISNTTNATTADTISNETIIVPNPTTAIPSAITTTAVIAKPFSNTTTPATAKETNISAAASKPPHTSSSAQAITTDRSTQTNASSPMPQRFARSLPQYPVNISGANASMNHTTITTTSTTIATTPVTQHPVPPSSRLTVPSAAFTPINQPISCPVDRSVAYVPTSGEHTNASNNSALGNNINTKPSLAVVAKTPSATTLIHSSRNWYYLTKFQPHETEANIINYIAHHAHCEPTQIACHRLIRSGDDRPLSFLSFKLYVPSNIEQTLLLDDFWPNGVSMTPFLDRRSNTRNPIGTRKQAHSNRPFVYTQPTPSPRLQDARRFQPSRPTTALGLRQEVLRLQAPQPTPAPQQTQPHPPKRQLPQMRATLV